MSTYTGQVAASADDANSTDADGSTSSTLSTPTITSSTTASSRGDVGFRFAGVTIPQGAAIASATLQVYGLSGSKLNSVLAHIFGEAVDNSANFTTTPHVSTRARTSASTAWSATGLAVGFNTSPDITAVIQELVNRPGWVAGNAMVMLLCGDNSATSRTWQINTFDTAPADGAILTVNFTGGAPERSYPRGVSRGVLRGVA